MPQEYTDRMSQQKKDLRAHARQLRQELPEFEPAWQLLRPLTEQLRADVSILVYLASALEPDPAGVRAISPNPFAVTRTPEKGRQLTVHPFDGGTRLEQHPFGFLQPVASTPELPLDSIGLVLVPGLAFDAKGGRLGHGAGYYDRLLNRLPAGVPLVGLVHSRLLLDTVPMLEHDVPMTHVLTERALIDCRGR